MSPYEGLFSPCDRAITIRSLIADWVYVRHRPSQASTRSGQGALKVSEGNKFHSILPASRGSLCKQLIIDNSLIQNIVEELSLSDFFDTLGEKGLYKQITVVGGAKSKL